MQKYCQLLTGCELVIVLKVFNTLFTQRKNYLDCDLDLDPEDASVYTEHSLYNKDHHIIVYCSLLHRNCLISGLKLSSLRSR